MVFIYCLERIMYAITTTSNNKEIINLSLRFKKNQILQIQPAFSRITMSKKV